MFTDFGKKTFLANWLPWQKNILSKLVTMATRKRLFLIYEIENFANT